MENTIPTIDAHLAANPVQPHHGLAETVVSIRPILEFACTLLFFKPSWQKALKAFMAALDVEFPQ